MAFRASVQLVSWIARFVGSSESAPWEFIFHLFSCIQWFLFVAWFFVGSFYFIVILRLFVHWSSFFFWSLSSDVVFGENNCGKCVALFSFFCNCFVHVVACVLRNVPVEVFRAKEWESQEFSLIGWGNMGEGGHSGKLVPEKRGSPTTNKNCSRSNTVGRGNLTSISFSENGVKRWQNQDFFGSMKRNSF